RGDRTPLTHPLGLTMVAFVVTAIPAFLLTKIIGKHLESLYIMGYALLIGGVVMWVIDAINAKYEAAGPSAPGSRIHTWRMEDMSLGQAIWIGACQILSAVFPGTSRSMSTIAAGQIVGMSRAAALEFSFFLSIPTMVAATGYDLLKSLRHSEANPIGASGIDAHGWVLLFIGFVVSFIVAYGSVAWFMAWVRRRGFAPFAAYRIIVGNSCLSQDLRALLCVPAGRPRPPSPRGLCRRAGFALRSPLRTNSILARMAHCREPGFLA
ncbi:MAG: hypothetical protein DMG71_15890, partial [Acidobacteria bacterium]